MQIEMKKKNHGIVTSEDEIAKIISLMVERKKIGLFKMNSVVHSELVIQCFFYNDLQIKNLTDPDLLF